MGSALLAQMEDLTSDNVEKRQPIFDGQERFGAIHPHTGAKSAVELDDNSAAQGFFTCPEKAGIQPCVSRQGVDGLRFIVGNVAGRTCSQLVVVKMVVFDKGL